MKLRALPIISAFACAVVCTCALAEIYHGRVLVSVAVCGNDVGLSIRDRTRLYLIFKDYEYQISADW